MNSRFTSWDPYSSASWADLLGLAHSPLFGFKQGPVAGDHALLLDGTAASLAFTGTDDEKFLGDPAVSWSWSSHVRNAVIINRPKERVFVRRWDEPSVIRQFRIPSNVRAAESLLGEIAYLKTRAPSVVQHVMRGFRYIRSYTGDGLEALRALNGLLLACRAAASGQIDREAIRRAGTFSDIFSLLPNELRETAGLDEKIGLPGHYELGTLASYFLDPEPTTGCVLDPDLLLLHASSELYQEAHLEVERDDGRFLFGPRHVLIPAPDAVRGPRDVRYTPVNLVRALVEQALARVDSDAIGTGPFTVLDPACGSGIFLQEFLREVFHPGRPKALNCPVEVVGFDTSPIAVAVAKSSLHLMSADVRNAGGVDFTWQAERLDALEAGRDWPRSDLILMNPPFRSWQDMVGPYERQRETVRQVLGEELTTGRPDLALAFLLKAFRSLKPGGILAAVLPGAILETVP